MKQKDIEKWNTRTQKEGQEVKCKDCEYLMFSDCYGECSKAYKGIVSPNDSCEYGKRRTQKEG